MAKTIYTNMHGPVVSLDDYDILERELKTLRDQNEELEHWKKQQIEVWGPILDYMQSHPELSLGERISKRVLEFLKERDKLKSRILNKKSQV